MILSKVDEVSGAPLYGFDANSMTLYLKNIPIDVSRWDLLEQIKDTKGFVSLSMSEPLKAQEFERYAWITYDSDENCQNAKEVLETKRTNLNFRLNPIQSRGTRKNLNFTPEISESSIKTDLDQCQKLISEVMDPEKNIPATFFEKI